MLIFKRRATEEVILDEQSRLTVVSTSAGSVKLKVTVPQGVCIKKLDPSETLDCEAVLVPNGDTVVL